MTIENANGAGENAPRLDTGLVETSDGQTNTNGEGGGSESQTGSQSLTQQSQTDVDNSQNSPRQLTGKRANWTIAHKIDQENNSIVFSVRGAGELRLVLGTVHAENLKRATLHGFVQRISDAAAMARDSKTGASATPQQKFEAMKRLVEHYQSGAEGWSPQRAEGGPREKPENPNARLLRVALSIHSPQKSAETIAQFVKERNAAQLTALVMSEQLKEAVELAREQLREEDAKAAEGVDAEELLSGL